MKNTFTPFKLILTVLVGLSPLQAAQSNLEKKLLTLIEKTDTELTGWHNLKYRRTWSGKKRQKRINTACSELKQAQKELATMLAQLKTKDTTLTVDTYRSNLKKSTHTIGHATAPCHVRRNWVRYVVGGLSLAGLGYMAHRSGHQNRAQKVLNNLYTDHLEKPAANAYAILTSNKKDQTVLPQDAEHALKRYTAGLDQLIREAQVKGSGLESIVNNHIPQNADLSQIPLEKKTGFLDAMLTGMQRKLPEDIGNSFGQWQVWNWHVPKSTEMFIKSHTLFGQQLRLEKMLITQKVEDVSQKANLTIELIAAIPALAALYIGSTGIYNYGYNKIYRNYYTTIRKTLSKLQLQYNKERYSTNQSLEAQGMSLYWIHILKREIHKIPTQERATYQACLEQIESDTLYPAQKITVIENMLREHACLRTT